MNKVLMKLHPEPFAQIASGKKNIECRLYDEKRRVLRVGDVIAFTNRETHEVIEKEIGALHVFSSFHEMFDHFPEEGKGINMYQYYSKADEQTYGTVAIELK